MKLIIFQTKFNIMKTTMLFLTNSKVKTRCFYNLTLVRWLGVLLISGIVGFIIPGCEENSSDEDLTQKCDPVGVVSDNTGRYTLTYEDLMSDNTPYFSVSYIKDPEKAVFQFQRKTYNICLDGYLNSEADAWVHEPGTDITIDCYLNGDKEVLKYPCTTVGAGGGMYRMKFEIIQDYSINNTIFQEIYLRFPSRGDQQKNAHYVIDTLKLQLQFNNKYYKAKIPV